MKFNLRQLRLAQNLSYRQLAAKAGLSPGMLCQIEHGKVTPSLDSLAKIAKALNCSITQLLAESESDTAQPTGTDGPNMPA